MYRQLGRSSRYLGASAGATFPSGAVNLSFSLSAAGQAYFAATNLANLGAGADLSAVQSVLAGMSIFSNGQFTLAGVQWDNPSLPSALTVTLTANASGAGYQQSAIAASIADTLSNYFGNIGGATFSPIGFPGAGTITPAQAIASTINLNPFSSANLNTDAQAVENILGIGGGAGGGNTPTASGVPTWVWVALAGLGIVVVVAVVA